MTTRVMKSANQDTTRFVEQLAGLFLFAFTNRIFVVILHTHICLQEIIQTGLAGIEHVESIFEIKILICLCISYTMA